MHLRTSIFSSLLLLAFCLMSSCSHYRIVDLGAFPYKNLYINNISNQSFAPNAQILFNSQLRQRLLEKGNIRLVNEPSLADCQLFVEMVDYKRSPLSQANDDPGRINALDYTLSVLVSIYDNKEDTFLVEAHRLQSTEPLIYTQSENTVLSDIKEAEYRSIPRITNDLASQITDLIYGNW